MVEHYIAIILVAVGTYLTRFLPIHFNGKFKGDDFLAYSSTALISALFVTTLVSFPIRLGNLGMEILALALVVMSYGKWRNLGISVLVGVVVHLSLSLVVGDFI